jgi:hypothetical protein
MNWEALVAHLKGLGYRGEEDDLDAVSTFLKGQGFDPDALDDADAGRSYTIKELFDGRKGKPLDISVDDRVAAAVDAAIGKRGIVDARNRPRHDVTVGRERVLDDPLGGFKHAGEFYSAVIKAGQDHNEVPEKLRVWQKDAVTIYGNETVGADGGFAVPEQMRTDITVKVQGEDSVLSRTDQLTTASNSLAVPYDDDEPWNTSGIQAEWSGEANAHTQRKPLLEQRRLQLRKSYISRKAADVIDFAVGESIFRGTGATQPLGFLNGGSTVPVAIETNQAPDTILGMNIVKMWSRMYGPWKRSAVWFVSPTTFPELQRATITGRNASGGALSAWGGFVMLPAGGVTGSPFQTIFGRPVIETEHCEEVGDVGDIVLASMSQYATLTKGNGVESATSMHIWFDQDVMAMKFRLRIDGQPWSNSTITPRDSSSSTKTLGAFVTLAARA